MRALGKEVGQNSRERAPAKDSPIFKKQGISQGKKRSGQDVGRGTLHIFLHARRKVTGLLPPGQPVQKKGPNGYEKGNGRHLEKGKRKVFGEQFPGKSRKTPRSRRGEGKKCDLIIRAGRDFHTPNNAFSQSGMERTG